MFNLFLSSLINSSMKSSFSELYLISKYPFLMHFSFISYFGTSKKLFCKLSLCVEFKRKLFTNKSCILFFKVPGLISFKLLMILLKSSFGIGDNK